MVPGTSTPYDTSGIKKINRLWINNRVQIIAVIKNHQKKLWDQIPEVPQDENTINSIYLILRKFLFLCIPKTVKKILTNTPTNLEILIEVEYNLVDNN